MKIEGPSKTGQASKSNKSGKTTKTGASFGDMLTQATQGGQQTQAAQSINQVDALLAVQGAEDPTERAARRRVRERGENILRKLDNIRLGLLTGRLSAREMLEVADVIASHREKINDPRMTAVLDEIDLRAQIELAKMKKGLGH